MIRITPRKLVILGTAVAAIAGLYGYQQERARSEQDLGAKVETLITTVGQPSVQVQILRELVRERGPVGVQEAMMEYFRQGQRRAIPNQMHTVMHALGDVFFELYGSQGITYCRSYFEVGCQHGVAIRALYESGPEGIGEILSSCLKNAPYFLWECSHGIGHGLLLLADDELAPALAACEKAGTTAAFLEACFDGVFMEHAFARVNGRSSDVFRPDDYQFPCRDTLLEYRYACWLNQPYRVLLGSQSEEGVSEDEALTRVISLCSSLQGRDRRACLNGYSRAIASLTFGDLEKTLSLCQRVGAEGHYDACIVWNVLSLSLGDTTLPFRLCEYVTTKKASSECSVRLWEVISKAYASESSQYAALCSKIPDEAVSAECLKHPRVIQEVPSGEAS